VTLQLDEPKRQEVLEACCIMDTLPSEAYDRIVKLAAMIFDVPIALVSLIDKERQWFKAKIGIDATETPREWAFCDFAIRSPKLFEITDPEGDARFCDNPLVTGPPYIRYYAGMPLVSPEGYALGTLCIIDTKKRTALTEPRRQILSELSDMVMHEIEIHRKSSAF
jgi:GAF domain-containing protein